MGSVWLATRFDHEFNRNVAIKMVRRGMDAQEILRRFRRTANAANLDHPNIALLIDGGSTPEACVLVMEYVEGRPSIATAKTQLSITDRLKLFRAVCSAVQYATESVVHRDIKAGIFWWPPTASRSCSTSDREAAAHDSSTLDLAQTRPKCGPYAGLREPERGARRCHHDRNRYLTRWACCVSRTHRQDAFALEAHPSRAAARDCREKAAAAERGGAGRRKDRDPEARKLEVPARRAQGAQKSAEAAGRFGLIVLKALRKSHTPAMCRAEQFPKTSPLSGGSPSSRAWTLPLSWGNFCAASGAVRAAVAIAAGLMGIAAYSATDASCRSHPRGGERRDLQLRRE